MNTWHFALGIQLAGTIPTQTTALPNTNPKC